MSTIDETLTGFCIQFWIHISKRMPKKGSEHYLRSEKSP